MARSADPEPDDNAIVRPRLKLTRSRAARLDRASLPWVSGVKLPWGLEVRLLNVSSSGMLVESTSKLMPGSVADVEIRSGDDVLVVPARFVRSEIVGVDRRGVRYVSAAVFEEELDLEDPRANRAATASSRKGLAAWLKRLAAVLDKPAAPASVRKHIEEGLRTIVGAHDVQILDEPAPAPPGCESIYFSVVRSGDRRAILQVTFEPGQTPSELDFRLLQTGAALAGVVMQLGSKR
jgi:hypothetical protein